MSYILEALKKSQAERELGRVPTLDGVGLFAEDKLEPPRSAWALVSVGLAVTAVLIALYAALRQPPSQVTAPPAARDPMAMTSLPREPIAAITEQLPASAPAVVTAAVNPGGSAYPAAAAGPPVPVPPGSPPGGIMAPAITAAPLVEAPPPKGGVRPPPPAVSPAVPEPVVPVPPDVEAKAVGASDAALELELQRQLDAEPVNAQDAEEWIDAPPDEPVPTPIPPDLIADIESFKHQRQPRQVPDKAGKAPVQPPSARPTSPPLSGAARFGEDPSALRLSRDQQASLPAFLMTVHVYEAEPSRRFVLINGLKYRDGDRTREGLTVEQIVADGAVLSVQGNPFFVHR